MGGEMTDDSAMEEGRLEEIRSLVSFADLIEPHLVREILEELDRLRAENDALKQQLQELRAGKVA